MRKKHNRMPKRSSAQSHHPSHFIQEEMAARGWDVQDLAVRMAWREIQINQLALEMYFACVGSQYERDCRLGDIATRLGEAFAVDHVYFQNLERHYLEHTNEKKQN
jgi:plasmid maintenance system antidote protein VapI